MIKTELTENKSPPTFIQWLANAFLYSTLQARSFRGLTAVRPGRSTFRRLAARADAAPFESARDLIAARVRREAGGALGGVAADLRAEAAKLNELALARLEEAIAIEEALAWRLLRGEPPPEEDGAEADAFRAARRARLRRANGPR